METFDKVREIICEQLDAEAETVTMEASILEDLEADSLDVVDLVMNLEEAFDTEIPDTDIEQLKTVGDVVRYIDSHAAQENPSEED